MTRRDVLEISIDALQPGRYQPRLQLREEGLTELAESIREQGVLQPLIVRAITAHDAGSGPAHAGPGPGRDEGSAPPYDEGSGPAYDEGSESRHDESAPPSVSYEIVAGERRWRAARLAGLATVPAIVRDLSDQAALAVALIENLQREDLNPIEQARSMAQLLEEFDLTHDEIAKALGRSRSSVTNYLRLLDLADDVKDKMIDGKLDMGHARALLPLDAERQSAVARKIVRLGWSVRKVEKTVQSLLAERPAAPSAPVDLQTRWLERQLARELGEKVSIQPGPGGDYVLKLRFADLTALEAHLERLQAHVRQIREAAGPRAREKAS